MNDNSVKVVWSGCDGYVLAENAVREGYNFDGERLYHKSAVFVMFDATKVTGDVDIDSPPKGVFYFVMGDETYAAKDDGSDWEDME